MPFRTRRPKPTAAGFASVAAVALVLVMAIVLGTLSFSRQIRELEVFNEQTRTTTAVAAGESYHRLVCRYVERGDFAAILGAHTQSRIENARQESMYEALTNGEDPLHEQARHFFNTAYLLAPQNPPLTEQDIQGLPPQTGKALQDFLTLRYECLIQTKHLRTAELPNSPQNLSPFAYDIEIVVKTRTSQNAETSSPQESAQTKQEHVSRFLARIQPARPEALDSPRPFFTPPFPALFLY